MMTPDNRTPEQRWHDNMFWIVSVAVIIYIWFTT